MKTVKSFSISAIPNSSSSVSYTHLVLINNVTLSPRHSNANHDYVYSEGYLYSTRFSFDEDEEYGLSLIHIFTGLALFSVPELFYCTERCIFRYPLLLLVEGLIPYYNAGGSNMTEERCV